MIYKMLFLATVGNAVKFVLDEFSDAAHDHLNADECEDESTEAFDGNQSFFTEKAFDIGGS